MLAKKASFLLIIGAALSFPLTAVAQAKGVTSTAGGKGGVVSVDSLITRYEPLAGPWSPKSDNPKLNATSLVNGVRSGEQIGLYGPMLVQTETKTPIQTQPQTPFTCPKPPLPCTPPKSGSGSGPVQYKIEYTTVYKTIYFNSPIGATGFGNVDIALALAEADAVEKKGLAKPLTPEQLQAALIGGTVATAIGGKSTVTFTGVLALRAKGSGWGEVAKALELELVEKK